MTAYYAPQRIYSRQSINTRACRWEGKVVDLEVVGQELIPKKICFHVLRSKDITMDESEGQVHSIEYTNHHDKVVDGLGLGEIELREEKTAPRENKMLRSWKDIARRVRLFEYCKVENPNEEPTELNGENATQPPNGQKDADLRPSASGDETDGVDGRVQDIDQFETRPRKQSLSSPFNFPQKPIEQIEMLRNEVNLERQSSFDKQQFSRSPSHSFRLHNHPELPETILEETENDVIEEEADKLSLSLPLFQRLSLLGDNSSGVNVLLISHLQ